MLAPRRRLDGLVVDASVCHGDAELHERCDRASLLLDHRCRLAQHAGGRKIRPTRVRYRRNAYAPLPALGRSQSFQIPHASFAETFGIGHDVRLGNGHKVSGTKEVADAYLMS